MFRQSQLYNLCEYIYKDYDHMQNDSVNPYALPVSGQKLMTDNLNSLSIEQVI